MIEALPSDADNGEPRPTSIWPLVLLAVAALVFVFGGSFAVLVVILLWPQQGQPSHAVVATGPVRQPFVEPPPEKQPLPPPPVEEPKDPKRPPEDPPMIVRLKELPPVTTDNKNTLIQTHRK